MRVLRGVGRAILVVSLGSGLALALPAAPGEAAPPAASTLASVRDVNDFRFSRFEADYYLDRDSEGRSTLTTVESLTAVFPETDQNHGIQRVLVEDYQGTSTDLDVVSVTDETGAARDYDTESDEGLLFVTIAADGFVHGEQTYVLTYTQHDVTRYFADTQADEFQWDTNGTGWRQPFDTVEARIHLSSALAAKLTGNAACYRGVEGSREVCEITTAPGEGNDGAVLTAGATGLGIGENVTVAIGFAPSTFVPRSDSRLAVLASFFFALGILLMLAGLVWAIVYRLTSLRDGPGRPVIIPEYLPPSDPELLVAAVLVGRSQRAVAATLVSFAVRGIARIVDGGRRFWGGQRWSLEYLSTEGTPRMGSGPAGVAGLERSLAHSFFGSTFEPGERADLSTADSARGQSIAKVLRAARKAALSRGYQRTGPPWPIAGILLLAGAGGLIVVVAALLLLDQARGGTALALAFLLVVVTAIAVSVALAKRPLTAKGAELRDYLKGVRMYLRLAETDRLRVLQSPQGAQRSAVDATDGTAVVHLYERLLPYAVLFGVERDWVRQLGNYYESTGRQPDWYAGSTAFNASSFASGMGSFSTSTAASFSGSTSSSSSGGSGGGGSSGGGGGGGGGGGV